MENETIKGGAILLARQVIESNIFNNKPAIWFKIWIYLLCRASHKDTKEYKRGETFLQYEWMGETTKATPDQIKKCIKFLRDSDMISTRRSTRGVWIKIANYSQYQDINSYSYKVKSTTEALEKHQRSTREALRYNKNDKNDKNDKIQKATLSENPKTISELIKIFEEINPSINYGHKTIRDASNWLIEKLGEEKAKAYAKAAIAIHGKKYAPTITTPYQLKNKISELDSYYKKEASNKIVRV